MEEAACIKPPGKRIGHYSHCDPEDIAGSYAAAGDKEKGLYWLRRALDENRTNVRAPCWVASNLETGYEDLRSDPRFKEILRSLGLPE